MTSYLILAAVILGIALIALGLVIAVRRRGADSATAESPSAGPTGRWPRTGAAS